MKTEPGSSAISRLRRPLGAVRIATANVRRTAAGDNPEAIDSALSFLNGSLYEFEAILKRFPKNLRRRLRKRYRSDLDEAELALFEGSSLLNQAEIFLGELVKAANEADRAAAV